MLILFDLDDTLFDHRATDRNAAAFLYENLGVAGTLSGFLLAWYAAQESHMPVILPVRFRSETNAASGCEKSSTLL